MNAPFSWPKSSLSISSVGMAAQLTLTKARDASRLSRWMWAASSSLPVPDSPDQQNPRVGFGHLRRFGHRAPERRALADHSWRLAHQVAECLILDLQVRSLQRVLDDEQHAIARERLLEEIERAVSRRLDRVLDRPVARDHDHGRRIAALSQPAQHVQTAAVRQPHVEQVEIGATGETLRLELRRRLAHRDAVSLAFEDQAQ